MGGKAPSTNNTPKPNTNQNPRREIEDEEEQPVFNPTEVARAISIVLPCQERDINQFSERMTFCEDAILPVTAQISEVQRDLQHLKQQLQQPNIPHDAVLRACDAMIRMAEEQQRAAQAHSSYLAVRQIQPTNQHEADDAAIAAQRRQQQQAAEEEREWKEKTEEALRVLERYGMPVERGHLPPQDHKNHGRRYSSRPLSGRDRPPFADPGAGPSNLRPRDRSPPVRREKTNGELRQENEMLLRKLEEKK